MNETEVLSNEIMPSSILGIHHIGIAVRNLSEAIAFYRSAASLESVDVKSIGGPQPEMPSRTAVLKGPNGYLELMQFESPENDRAEAVPVEGPGITHICYQSPAKLGLYNKFMQLNAKSVSRAEPPIDLNGQGVRYAYARDADNIMFEVEELDAPSFDGPIWIAHISLVTPDIDQLVSFYRNLLGIEPYGRANKVVGERFDEVTGLDNVRIRAAWFNTGNMVIELWQYINPVTQVPGEPLPFARTGYNVFAFEVKDLDAEIERLERMGVEVIGDGVEVEGMRKVFARDPDGNLFSLLETGPTAAVSVVELEKIDWLPSPSSPLIGKSNS